MLSASPHRVAVLAKCPPPDTVRRLPRADDQIWIVTDRSVTRQGIGATVYVSRENKLLLAGFFSAKIRKHQVTWLPCEIEALSIAAAIKHFVEKLCRGEFSASPRVTSFLSTVSRYQINVRHLNSSVNIPSDFASRNASECTEPRCQIYSFITQLEDSVVRSAHVQDIMDNQTRLPFTTRSAWLAIQTDCPDLRRTHAHLKQGTRTSKKTTNIKDVKRYLSVASIATDDMLVVRLIILYFLQLNLSLFPVQFYMVFLLHCISNLTIHQDIN